MRRKIEDTLQAWKKQDKPLPLMILGARQTGKTNFVKRIFKMLFLKRILALKII
ncbi:MAG: hypothetical protein LBR36_05010 [Bacteroidales bacterium]|jgi:predicted AAA+ superfamily ATPase|nr:hypothetical protein [Bacteroidales bacterium]